MPTTWPFPVHVHPADDEPGQHDGHEDHGRQQKPALRRRRGPTLAGQHEGEYHNYFVFDLGTVNQAILSAQLNVANPTGGYFSPDPTETYTLFDVSTPLAALQAAGSGQVDAAIKTLDKNNKGDNRDLLYFMEMGELQRLAKRYERSQKEWMTGDRKVQDWEAAAKLDPLRVSGSVASYVINDKLRNLLVSPG